MSFNYIFILIIPNIVIRIVQIQKIQIITVLCYNKKKIKSQ